jgi:hypothetical protein
MACDEDDDLSAKPRSASELPLQFPKLSILFRTRWRQHQLNKNQLVSRYSANYLIINAEFSKKNMIGKSRNATHVLTHRETLLNECRSFPHTIIRMS